MLSDYLFKRLSVPKQQRKAALCNNRDAKGVPEVVSFFYALEKGRAISSRESQLRCHSSQYPGGLPPEPADQLSAVSIVVYTMITIPKQQSKTSAMRCHGLVATALR